MGQSNLQLQNCAFCVVTDMFNVKFNKQVAGAQQGATIYDPQTEADRSSQLCIISSIQKQFPKVHILGEEVDAFSLLQIV